MLKTTGSSVASAFRVNDDEVVGGGDARAKSDGSIVEQKVGSITPTKVPVIYTNFANVFSPDLASKLPKRTRVNNYTMELVNVIEFIRPSKSSTGALIFFDWKSDRSPWLCVDYRSLNILIAMSTLMAETVKIAISSLTLLDKLGKVWFFQKMFCWLTLALFFIFNNADIWFAGKELVWMTYTAADNQADRTLER